MTYRLARHTRITPSQDCGDGAAVLVDSRNFTAHLLNSSAFFVVSVLVADQEPTGASIEMIAERLHMEYPEAEKAVETLMDEMVRHGWVIHD
ncbi:PqqD family protein [Kribbella sp. NPDC055110]